MITSHRHCQQCRGLICSNSEECPHCGLHQIDIFSRLHASERSRITAALFALLLGGIGAHKFYLGKLKIGMVYLALCWTFIPSMVGLFEGLLLLLMTDQEFAAKYPQSIP